MARQTINIGTNANDGTGDPLRTAFDKINDNFLELYGADGDANTLQGNLDINGFNIISATSNQNIRIIPNGTGTVELEKSTNITGALTVSTTAAITGNATVGGTLGVTGLSTLASFKGATGTTVTAILDEDTLSSNSDTALATQQSIKAYVDSQVTAQDLDFQGDTGGALAVDLDSQTFTIAGGTGIDTAGSGQTLTVNIDSSVVTLTGSQVLTGKTLTTPTINGATMTGSVTIDNLIFNDTDITTSSNANLVLNPGGTGTIELQANTNVTGTATVSGLLTASANATVAGTLTTADITTVGNQTISGDVTIAGRVLTDRISSPDSNADLELSTSGTGRIKLLKTVESYNHLITGNVDVFGTFSVDNIELDGNVIRTTNTNGGIELTTTGTGYIQLNSSQVTAPGLFRTTNAEVLNNLDVFNIRSKYSNSDITIAPQGVGRVRIEGTGLEVDAIRSTTSNTDLVIATQGTATIDFGTPTQSSVGAATGATALPGNPVGFLKFKLNGTDIVVPYWNAS